MLSFSPTSCPNEIGPLTLIYASLRNSPHAFMLKRFKKNQKISLVFSLGDTLPVTISLSNGNKKCLNFQQETTLAVV